jgi:capsular polysaccharide biosynthesis protein
VSLPRLDSALRDRPWAYDDYPPVEDESVADPTAGLASLGYIATAIRRRLALVGAAALIGLFVGTAGYVLAPPAFQAEISLYLSTAPGQNPGQAMGTDVTLAQAHSVDAAVVRKLGLAESPSQLLASYTVTAETNEVMLIMTRAPSSAEAMREATAVATEFLRFRANQADTEQQAELATLNQQITQEKQQVAATTRQLTAAVAEPVSAARTAELARLRPLSRREQLALAGLQQTATGYPVTTAQQVAGSGVLDAAAAIPRSRLRTPAEYVGGGLVGGLVLGAGFVVVGALVSDRLRRRDDVSRALGAPVGMSVGRVRAGGRVWRPGLRVVRGRPVVRAGAYLGGLVPGSGSGPSGLAVVPVGGDRAAAAVVAAAALARARAGAQVIVADLGAGAPAARLLGVRGPGVKMASGQEGQLAVVVPEPGEIAPAGPAVRPGPGVRLVLAREVYQAADVLLVLVPLDPLGGSEHLASWAGRAVAVVSAGETSATRINAVGELIRLAGVTQLPAVLLGADRNDETVGATLLAVQRPSARPDPARSGPDRPGSDQRAPANREAGATAR